MRKLLLDRSATIVQDDSGIPLAYFGKRWRLRLSATMLGPSRCSQASTSPKWQGCFKALTRSIRDWISMAQERVEPSPRSNAVTAK